MKPFILLLLCVPAWLIAEPTVLVDAIPSDATYLGSSPVRLPFRDAESQDVKSMESGMSAAVLAVLKAAGEQGFSYVCLLSVPGDDPIEISIPTVETKLKLRRTKTMVTVAYYKDGRAAATPIAFMAGEVKAGRPQVSMKIDKISVPSFSTPADWIYLNLPRIQSEATKAAAPIAMLQVTGTGPLAEVAVPGMKEPLMVPEEEASLTASWYLDSAADK